MMVFNIIFCYGHKALHWNSPEHVESWQRSGDESAVDLRVPVKLLDLRLALMQEQQLRWELL